MQKYNIHHHILLPFHHNYDYTDDNHKFHHVDITYSKIPYQLLINFLKDIILPPEMLLPIMAVFLLHVAFQRNYKTDLS